MKLLERLFPVRRLAGVFSAKPMRGMWEFRTGREDVGTAYFSSDMQIAFGIFSSLPRGNRMGRLTGNQLRLLLSHDQSQYLRPEFAE